MGPTREYASHESGSATVAVRETPRCTRPTPTTEATPYVHANGLNLAPSARSSASAPTTLHSHGTPMSRSRISITVFGALALAACTADRIDPVSPLAVSPARSVSTAARLVTSSSRRTAASRPTSPLASPRSAAPSSSSTTAPASRCVSNLSASAVSQLGGFSEVSDLQADADVTLDAPLAASQLERRGSSSANSVGNPASAILARLAVEHAAHQRQHGVGGREARRRRRHRGDPRHRHRLRRPRPQRTGRPVALDLVRRLRRRARHGVLPDAQQGHRLQRSRDQRRDAGEQQGGRSSPVSRRRPRSSR